MDRLETVLEVNTPVENGRSLIFRDADLTRMKNWKNRLSTQLKKLSIFCALKLIFRLFRRSFSVS